MKIDLPQVVAVLLIGSILTGCRFVAEEKISPCSPTFLVLGSTEGPDEIIGDGPNTKVSGLIAVIGCRADIEQFKSAEIQLARKQFQHFMAKDGFGFILGARVPEYRLEIVSAVNMDSRLPEISDYFLFSWSMEERGA